MPASLLPSRTSLCATQAVPLASTSKGPLYGDAARYVAAAEACVQTSMAIDRPLAGAGTHALPRPHFTPSMGDRHCTVS